MQLAAILTASVLAVERCPIGYVAFDNGQFCCPFQFELAQQPELDLGFPGPAITYESQSCRANRQCQCGGPYDNVTDEFGGCTDQQNHTTGLICEQYRCPSDHPFAYNFGRQCCDTDPGGYDEITCTTNVAICPGNAHYPPYWETSIQAYVYTSMYGACGNYIGSAEDITLNNQTTLNNEASSSSSSELSTGSIIGIVAGSVVFLTVAYFGAVSYTHLTLPTKA